MGTNHLIFALLLGIITITSSCGKTGFGCAKTTYNFKADIRAYPDRDSIRVGDTIWYEASIPTAITDIRTKHIINYSGAVNLGSDYSLQKLIGGSISDPGPAAGDFKFILITGKDVTKSSFERSRVCLFTEINNNYIFKLGIIALKKGVYISGIGNPNNVYRENDSCTKASYAINFANTNQHLYLYQSNWPGYNIMGLELTNAYCFKVY